MRHPISIWSGSRWPSLSDFGHAYRDLDKLVEGFWGQTSANGKEFLSGFSPSCDVEETENSYLVSFDIPGIDKDKLNIELSNNVLTVTGEREQAEKNEKKGCYHYERFYGKFSRSLNLPESVNDSKVEASYKDGVLNIEIPKSESSKPKQIKVK
jgi:HSP20 family protein